MRHVMRLAAVIAALCAFQARAESPPSPLPWLRVSEFYVTPSPSRIYGPNNAVYVQTRLPEGSNVGPQQVDTWHTVDLAAFGVPSDAVAAYLSGMLVITGGTTPEIANITIGFRRPGDTTSCGKYLGQATFQTNSVAGQSIIGGQRTNMATWVPLSNGKLEFCYSLSTAGAWPDNPSYAINLSIQAWAR